MQAQEMHEQRGTAEEAEDSFQPLKDSHVEPIYTEDVVEPIPEVQKKASTADRWSIVVSGAALISDGYFNNVMTMTNVVFKKLYTAKVYTSYYSSAINYALFVASIIGMLVVGLVCDRVGRKAGIVITTTLLMLGATLATAAYPVHGNVHNLFWWLIICRGVIGFGVGGEYPASSTSASESANEKFGNKTRASVFILVTNLLLTLGGPFACIFFLIVLSASSYDDSASAAARRDLEIVWRVCFGFGALLPLSIFVLRIKMLNSKLYRKNAMRRRVPYGLALRKYGWRLFGTAGIWWLYDFVIFPNGVFSGLIIQSILTNPSVKATAEWQLLLSVLSIPGCLLGAYLIRYIGARWLLVGGFSGYIIIGLVVGCAFTQLKAIVPLFVVLYGLMQSAGNFGPGNACGLIAAESFPTPLRGTFYGFSAAFGKFGAVIGIVTFTRIQTHLGNNWTFIIAAIIGAVGVLFAVVFVKDTTRKDLQSEDEIWIEYLKEKGWKGDMGDGSEGYKHINEANIPDAAPVYESDIKASL